MCLYRYIDKEREREREREITAINATGSLIGNHVGRMS